MPITVRIRGPGGSSSVQVDGSGTLQGLQKLIEEAHNIKISRQDLRVGFPPQSLPIDTSPSTLLSILKITNGESVIVSELPEAASSSARQFTAAPTLSTGYSSSVAPSSDADKSPLQEKGNGHDPPPFEEVDSGYLVLRTVPDDNSCLFTAVGLVLEGGRQVSNTQLREVISEAITADPITWSDAVLGRPPKDYIQTISRPNSWGGAIELAIFASHYNVEICSIDVQTGRVDRFGEGQGFENQVFLVYSGIHYDALAFSFAPPEPSESFPPPNLDFDTTLFPTYADNIHAAAQKLVGVLRAQHAYTDAANFTLKCEICKVSIIGEKDARQHAEETGHAQFGEYDG